MEEELNQKIKTTFLLMEDNVPYVLSDKTRENINTFRKTCDSKWPSVKRDDFVFKKVGGCLYQEGKSIPIFDLRQSKSLVISFAFATLSFGLVFAMTDGEIEKL